MRRLLPCLLLLGLVLALAPRAVRVFADEGTAGKAAGKGSVMPLLRSALRSEAEDRPEQALSIANEALRMDPAYAPLWLVKGRLLLRLQQYDPALRAILTGLSIDPADTESRLVLFRILVAAPPEIPARYGQSLKGFLAPLAPGDRARMLRALVAEPVNLRHLKLALDACPPAVGPMAVLEGSLRTFALGDTAGAGKALLAVDFPKGGESELAGDTAVLLARRLGEAGSFDEALALLHKAGELGYDASALRVAEGRLLLTRGDPAAALEVLLTQWRDDPQIGARVQLIAEAALKAGKNDTAKEFARRSLEFGPDDPLVQGRYLAAMVQIGDTDAAENFEEKMQDAETMDGVDYGRSLVESRAGHYREAASWLEKVRDPLPFRSTFLDFALELIAKATDLAPGAKAAIIDKLGDSAKNPMVQRDLGWDYWNARQWDAAAREWQAAMAGGLPEIMDTRDFSQKVVMLLFEQDRADAALAFMRRWIPDMTPFGLAWSALRMERYDLSVKILPLSDLAAHAPYGEIALILSRIRNGDTEGLGPRLDALSAAPAGGLRALPCPVFGPQGEVTQTTIEPAEATGLYEKIADAVLGQQLTDLYSCLMPPAWLPGLSPAVAAGWQTRAGKTLFRAGRMDDAKRFLESAARLNPSDPTATLYLALVLRRQGRGEEADRLMAQALSGVSTFDREFALGDTALFLGHGEEALDHFGKALALAPDDADLRLQVVNLLLGMDRYAEARQTAAWFEARLAAGDRAVRTATAEVRLALGDPAGSEKLWRELLAEQPGSTGYLAGLGRALFAQRRYAEVVDLLREPFERTGAPNLADSLLGSEQALGRPADVLRHAERGLEIAPDSLELLRYAAESAETLNDLPAEERYSARYTAIRPVSIPMQLLYGQSLLDQNKFPEARKHYTGILAVTPGNVDALRAMVTLGQMSEDGKTAYEYARRLHEAEPDDPPARLKYGSAVAGESEFRQAYAIMEPMRALGPDCGVLTLLYPRVTAGDSSGVVSLAQFAAHLKLLSERHAVFLDASDFTSGPDGRLVLKKPLPARRPGVILLVGGADRETLLKMDGLLREAHAKAMLAVDSASLGTVAPYGINRQGLEELAATGRWTFALSDSAPPSLLLADGQPARFWGQRAMLRDGSLETTAQMKKRMEERMALLRRQAKGLPVTAWFYPDGYAPNRLLRVDGKECEAFREVVGKAFPVAFGATPEGFWTPMADPLTFPAKSVLPSLGATAMEQHLDRVNPQHQVVLELAKAYMWHGQLSRADDYFREARALPVDPGELDYNQGANAYYEDDVPTAIRLLNEAALENPDSPWVQRMRRRAELRAEPLAEAGYEYWWDSDKRAFQRVSVGGEVSPRDDLRLFGNTGALSWRHTQDGTASASSLQGQDVNVGARWFFRPGYWFEALGGVTMPDHGLSSFPTFQATLHGPYSTDFLKLNGTYEVQVARARMDEIEAMLDEIREDSVSLRTDSRLLDFWDVSTNLVYSQRTDGNDTISLDGRIMRRITEVPLFSVGYVYQLANSDRNPQQYWAPQDVWTNLLYGSLSGNVNDSLRLNAGAGYGPSHSRSKGWDMVWRADAGMDYTVNDVFDVNFRYSRLETPGYRLNEIWGAVSYRF